MRQTITIDLGLPSEPQRTFTTCCEGDIVRTHGGKLPWEVICIESHGNPASSRILLQHEDTETIVLGMAVTEILKEA